MSDENKKPARKKTWIEKAQARDKWLPVSIAAVALGGVMAREKKPVELSLDFLMFCAVVAFIFWCLWPSSKKDDSQ